MQNERKAKLSVNGKAAENKLPCLDNLFIDTFIRFSLDSTNVFIISIKSFNQ